MKKFIAAIILLSCFLLISCQSSKLYLPVPGDHAAKIKSIYSEYYNIAEIYYSLEKYEKAIEYYKLAINDKDNFQSIYYKLARSYVMAAQYTEAEQMFKALLSEDSENTTLKASLAYIYAMNEKTENAIELYDSLIQQYPENEEYVDNKLSVLLLNCETSEQLSQAKEVYDLLFNKFSDSTKLETFDKEIKALDNKINSQEEAPVEDLKDNSEIETESEMKIDDSDFKDEE